ncbi:hypothetical protein HYV88_01640 [Candidatus Woesearchaeota archaeon]|nr:hypothetical protein [Candidatus Woesearchaeota archaeon]
MLEDDSVYLPPESSEKTEEKSIKPVGGKSGLSSVTKQAARVLRTREKAAKQQIIAQRGAGGGPPSAPSPPSMGGSRNWRSSLPGIILSIIFLIGGFLLMWSGIIRYLIGSGNIPLSGYILGFIGLMVIVAVLLALRKIGPSRLFGAASAGYNRVAPKRKGFSLLILGLFVVIILIVFFFLGPLSGLGATGLVILFSLLGLLILSYVIFYGRKSKLLTKELHLPKFGLGWILVGAIILLLGILIWKSGFSSIYIYGGIALVLLFTGLYFLSRKDKKFLGWSFIIISILVVFITFAPASILKILPYNQLKTWLLLGSLFLTIVFLFSKKYKLLGLLFLLITIGIWYFGSEGGSLFLESLGTKAQVAGGESFSAKLGKYLNYIKNPEQFFARYGEFGNPNIENKAPVGLKIDKFEPLIKEFRSNQDLRFTAEVKHYALPKFKEDDKVKSQLGFLCYIPEEKHQTEKGRTIEPTLVSYFGNIDVKPGKIAKVPFIEGGIDKGTLQGAIYEEKGPSTVYKIILENEDLFKNFTKFVTCTFKAETVPAFLDKETRRAYLNISYENFITRSDIYVYLLGKEVYDKIEGGVLQAGGDLDTEFLYQLRSAASYPGLIDNERRTISEFSSGPVWLQTNILDQQPLKSGSNDQYTLRVKSMPNSVDWTNAINIKNIYLEVPSWFSPVDNRCDFSSGSVEPTGTSSSKTKRLVLKDKKELLLGCGGSGAGCGFTCDFTVGSGNEQNVQEYRISAYQVTDYTISQGTSFDYVKSRTTGVITENEKAENFPPEFMDGLATSSKKEDLERYVSICTQGKDTTNLLYTETITLLKKYCAKIKEVNDKLNLINTVTGADTGSTSPTTQPVGTGSEEFKAGQLLISKEQLDRLPIESIVDDSTYISYKKGNDGWYVTNIKEILIRKVSTDDIWANKPIKIYRVGTM